MKHESMQSFNDRYLAVHPMPDLRRAVKDAVGALEAADRCAKVVLDECAETLSYWREINDMRKNGTLEGWSEEDLARLDGEYQCAQRIVRALGYEVDHWFCSWPHFREVAENE